MMTIDELNELLALKDWDGICAHLESRGFRRLGDRLDWGVDLDVLHEKSAYREHIFQTDESTKRGYFGTLYKDNSVYTGYMFVSVTLLEIRQTPNGTDAPVPKRSLLFGDKPLSDEMLRERNTPCPCDDCGKVYLRKELICYRDRWICTMCMRVALKHDGELDLTKRL